ncbi:probable galacturonosyltransferase-like 10 [Rhododendron vialii]|uniref:probable galacturonosyltransferase-like 10 n=1 Tax=Rhododendron vialii TaxID=182163 RepID=UPI00265DBEEF|nr:probable galacturonosyltransferase-like 10 [Rhododendron vialii]
MPPLLLIIPLFLSLLCPSSAIRSFPDKMIADGVGDESNMVSSNNFMEAPVYENGHECPVSAKNDAVSSASARETCDDRFIVHVAMTLDGEYLRGSIAAVHSVLKHTSCPGNIYFHFIASDSGSPTANELTRIVQSTFPSLAFKVYPFDEKLVKKLISSSIRKALDNPLNYARSYLSDIIDECVHRVIYLDSDVVVVDDIRKLWSVSLTGSRVIGAPEYCHANLTKYFSDEFWSDPELSKVFDGKRPCYFNTGVMVMDLRKWREGRYGAKIEQWMEVQKERKIYELGSLPPFLLVFGGDVEPIHHRWNQHGLGGHNVLSSCRSLHPGPVSLLHWSGKGKPWRRLDEGNPCPVDRLWAPYDLYRPFSQHLEQR